MSATLAKPTDLTEEIKKLQAELNAAELARVRPEDRHAARIRKQLAEKEHELAMSQAAESAATTELMRQQAVKALEEIGDEIRAEKSRLDGLKAQYAQLPAKIQAGEFRVAQLLRAFSQAKQELGV